jgi:hypothetical protein
MHAILPILLAPFVVIALAISVVALVLALLAVLNRISAHLTELNEAPRLRMYLDLMVAALWDWSHIPPVLLTELLPLRARVLLVRFLFAMGDDAPSLAWHWLGILAAKIRCPTTCPRCGQRCGTIEILLGDRGPRPMRACMRCHVTVQTALIREAFAEARKGGESATHPPEAVRGAA